MSCTIMIMRCKSLNDLNIDLFDWSNLNIRKVCEWALSDVDMLNHERHCGISLFFCFIKDYSITIAGKVYLNRRWTFLKGYSLLFFLFFDLVGWSGKSENLFIIYFWDLRLFYLFCHLHILFINKISVFF